ncbi:MAG: helix-turn-helix domain-containing protein [Spirochaetes bacterium]|nr:helix-turn-helix domain-containing protein [Spirochaetota bacterium]
MESSEPSDKLLTLLEALGLLPGSGATHAEIREKTGLPAATLLRMLRTLERRGYVLRDAGKRYRPLFRLEKDLPWGEEVIAFLRAQLTVLATRTGQAAELLTRRGTDLYWYDKLEPEDQAVRILAQPGFLRTLQELDAPARLMLRRMPPEAIERTLDTARFRGILAMKDPLTWDQARRRIEATDPEAVVFDERGNANGIRRYAIAVAPRAGGATFLYAIAEAAVPANDSPSHRKHIVEILELARKRAEGALP